MFKDLKHKAFVPWVLLIIRVYVGWTWLEAGYAKITSSAWVGSNAGTALTGFLKASLAKTSGEHPDVQAWYVWLIQHIALPNAAVFSYLVSLGELFVGIGLILGIFSLLATKFGLFMNFNYLLAGAVSINPQLILLELILLWGGKRTEKYGLDYFRHKHLNKKD